MRAREFLVEDQRSTIQKLEELIAHPGTEETVRQVARDRLDTLRSKVPAEPRSRITVPVNVSEEDLDRPFLTGVQLGMIYENLVALSPSPSNIHFGRQGVVQMLVPPPFMGKTRQQYVAEIMAACPGSRQISSHMLGQDGYLFVISYI